MSMKSLQQPHPLVDTLARIIAVEGNFYGDLGILEDTWFLASDLTNEDSPCLKDAMTRQAVNHPQMDARTRGSYLIGEYSWYIAGVVIGTYLSDRRVPDFSPENMAIRFSSFKWQQGEDSGEADCLQARFLSGRFAVLPNDPAANHPDAIVLPDANALREWMRTAIEAHMTPLIERIHTVTRLGRQAQWSLVADSCAALFIEIAALFTHEQHGKAEGLSFVKVPGSPMNNPKTGYFTVQYLDHCGTFRARGGCCRYYTVAEDGDKCSSCVLRPTEERDQLYINYLSRKYTKDTAS